jgi:hypothetical protein
MLWLNLLVILMILCGMMSLWTLFVQNSVMIFVHEWKLPVFLSKNKIVPCKIHVLRKVLKQVFSGSEEELLKKSEGISFKMRIKKSHMFLTGHEHEPCFRSSSARGVQTPWRKIDNRLFSSNSNVKTSLKMELCFQFHVAAMHLSTICFQVAYRK